MKLVLSVPGAIRLAFWVTVVAVFLGFVLGYRLGTADVPAGSPPHTTISSAATAQAF